MIKKTALILIPRLHRLRGLHESSRGRTLAPGRSLTPAPARPEAVSNPEINAYLAGLNYDPRQILAEQVGDSVIPAKALPDEEHDDGSAIVIVQAGEASPQRQSRRYPHPQPHPLGGLARGARQGRPGSRAGNSHADPVPARSHVAQRRPSRHRRAGCVRRR